MRMGITSFPNGVSSFGVPLFGMGGLIPVPGNVYFVRQEITQTNISKPGYSAGSDGNSGLSPERPLATLSAAHSKMSANQNVVAVILGSNTTIAVRESADLAWTKDLCHIVGTTYNRVAQRCSIRETSGGTSVTKMMDNSADGCLFAGFHIFQGNSTAADQYGWDESGERNAW